MKFLKLIQHFFREGDGLKIVNVPHLFKKHFGEKVKEFETYEFKGKGNIYIAKKEKDPSYLKFLVLSEIKDEDTVSDLISKQAALLALSSEKPIYYEAEIKYLEDID